MTLNQEGANKHINKRILVLGSAPHTRMVTAYTWDDLPQNLNVADYDVVILNLEPLCNKELASSVTPGMLPSIDEFARLLFSYGSEIIILGHPETKIGGQLKYPIYSRWFPFFPIFEYKTGEKICEVASEFAYYFQRVRKWSFFAKPEHLVRGAYAESEYLCIPDLPKEQSRMDLTFSLSPIASTRFQKPIAFELRFQIVANDVPLLDEFRQRISLRKTLQGLPHDLKENIILKESSHVIWLPSTTEISNYDAVNLILKERYSLQFEQALPDWVAAYKLPGQIPIEEDISLNEKEIQRLENELTKAQQHLQHTSRFRKLLYEQGVEGLEPVVRDALRELGAILCDPPPKENREDGRFRTSAGQIGMLEIKGRTKSLKLEDVRQLDQWVRDALFKEKLKSKGILIANMYCSQPLEQRGNPFPDNCIDGAEIGNLCLMTTTQLFRALCSYQRNKLDVEEFWNTVFNTNGRCPLPELEPLGGIR